MEVLVGLKKTGVFVGDRREIEDGLFEEQFGEYQIRAGGVGERKFTMLQ